MKKKLKVIKPIKAWAVALKVNHTRMYDIWFRKKDAETQIDDEQIGKHYQVIPVEIREVSK